MPAVVLGVIAFLLGGWFLTGSSSSSGTDGASPDPAAPAPPAPTPPGGAPGKWFTWADFSRSSAASRIGDPNIPGPAERARIENLCRNLLDKVRDRLNRPITINSGFRTAAVNAAIDGSSSTSQHMTGEAADIVPAGFQTSRERAKAVLAVLEADGIPWDQIIWYDSKPHVHISLVDPSGKSPATNKGNRREVRRQPASGRTKLERP